MGIIHGVTQSHPVGIIGPVITGNAFFPIWYHIHGFAGPRELGWSDTLYSFLELDGPVQCNAPTCSGLAERIKDIMGQQAKPTTLDDTRKLAHSIDSRYWERLREKNRSDKTNTKSDDRSDNKSDKNISQASSSRHYSDKSPSTSKPHSNSNSNSYSNNHKSGKSSSNSGSSDKPAYSDKLKNGKLTPQEHQRRMDNELCLYCGETGHKAGNCNKQSSSSSKAKARAAKVKEKETSTSSKKD